MSSKVTFNADLHTYHVDGVPAPSVTTILRDTGLIDLRFVKKSGMHRGSVVHEIIHLFEDGTPELGEAEIKKTGVDELGYLSAYLSFRKQSKWETYDSEQIVANLKDTELYCGTADLFGLMHGEFTLLDIKTGSPQSWHGIQLAAYMCADTHVMRDGATLRNSWPKDAKRRNLYLRKDGSYRLSAQGKLGSSVIPYEDPAWENAWRMQLRFYNMDLGLKI
ncbi:MAG: hypothetical protein LAT56_00240 [Wenzhouxiangella sp.]|nr:hypothetical protein [Wenzhouxiangella sp.]